ncbi:hypothetical protein BCR33DRAFT_845124 [Rhizoclosmatium globosum]|uniref:G-protein coupled receptors family 2 profile 2 domain-containing protein n=1 Tax=Rhizoclosmatium globosum TaxID=329046 RepID=A0A1Y2D3N7_9FUNG|nr:hypothetical protein BCR33DRAFT_845124 [Rhizoclosmatium globosum]|eukprot:ORY53918.1 hypothetical protein BCR33DRAFT_845124 [Rhizoclosmatium globosum]
MPPTAPSENLLPIQTIFQTLGSLSLALNFSLVLCVSFNKRFHKPISYLQTCLAWCDIIQSLVCLIGPLPNNPMLCTIIGAVAQFAFNAVTFWSFCVSLYCYITVEYRPTVANRYWWFYHAYSWGLSALSVAILLWVGDGPTVFGDATYECWISSEKKEFRIWLFYVELWFHFFLILLSFWGIYRKIRAVQAAGLESQILPKADEFLEESPSPITLEIGNEGRRDTVSNGKSLVLLLPESRINSRVGSVVDFKVLDINTPTATAETSGTPRSRRISGQSILFPPSHRATITTIGKKRVLHFKLILRSSLIAIGFLVSWTPPTVARIWDMIGTSPVPDWLIIWVTVCFASSGLWNAGVFFLTWYWEDITSFFSILTQKVSEKE